MYKRKKEKKRVLLHHQRLDLIALKWKENVLFLMDYNNLQTWRTFILLLWHTVCVCGRGLHTQTHTHRQTVISLRGYRGLGVLRTRHPPGLCAKRCRTDGRAFGWLVYTGCVCISAYTQTHTHSPLSMLLLCQQGHYPCTFNTTNSSPPGAN